MARASEWEKVYQHFEVGEPARDKAWRVPRPDPRLERVKRTLSAPFAKPKVLLLGTQGSGKTTELYGLLGSLPDRRIGVYLDIADHVRRKTGDERVMDRLAPWEVVFLTGLAVWRAAKDLGFATEEDAEAIGAAARPLHGQAGADGLKIDVAKLASAMTIGLAAGATALAALPGLAAAGVASGMLQFLAPVLAAGEWKLPFGRSAASPDPEQHARALLQAVNGLFSRVRKEDWSFVVVVDGLDRVRDGEAVRRLFLESTLLGQLDAFTIACGPVALSRQARLGQLSGWEPTVLPELTVFSPAAPRTPAGQLEFFAELWKRRTGGLDIRIERPALDHLAWASGGRLREFVRLIQNLATEAYSAGADTVGLPMAEALVLAERQTFTTGFHRGYDEVLCRVRDDPRHQLPDVAPRPDGTNLVDELLARYWLLPYRNGDGDEWFHPHPLLLDRLTPPNPS